MFVAVHGAAGANHIFMQNGTAFLEILPRGFAAKMDGQWAKVFYYDTASYANFRVRYFTLNIEDKALSRAGKWEEEKYGDFTLWERDRYRSLPSFH